MFREGKGPMRTGGAGPATGIVVWLAAQLGCPWRAQSASVLCQPAGGTQLRTQRRVLPHIGCATLLCARRRGTVLQVQAVLKQDHASKLDKYKTGRGKERWKEAVAVSDHS